MRQSSMSGLVHHAALVIALTVIIALAALSCAEPAPEAPVPADAAPTVVIEPKPAPTVKPLIPTAAPNNPTAAQPEKQRDPEAVLYVFVDESPSQTPAYDRGDWRHWTDEDGDCQDARQEALIAENVGELRFKDSDRCRVAAGVWIAPFTGKRVTDPGDLDVDHMVPLANAHRSGGWAWSPERKRDYANNLDYPGHLVAVTSGANRSKGAKGPEEWRPQQRSYWCAYATDWIAIKSQWRLTTTRSERAALERMLQTCDRPPALRVVSPPSSPSAPAPTPRPSVSDSSYPSCDDAEFAGEPRVRGSKGAGRGFPKSKVPSARDGDGDGVVCER